MALLPFISMHHSREALCTPRHLQPLQFRLILLFCRTLYTPAVFLHYLCVYAGLSVLGTLRHSKIFCHEFFSTSVHTHVH